ncbi:MAG: outer membrane protein [Hyphomicrobiaceae bacterium]
MRRSKLAGLVSGLAAFAAACAPASALDLHIATDDELAGVDWTGFSAVPYFGYETLRFKGNGADFLKDAKGWRLGGEADYDRQFGNLVLGVAGEAYYTWYDGNGAGGSPLASRLYDYGTVRGKIGYASGRWLIYATGGYAFGDLGITNAATNIEDRKFLNGWTAGAGVEWAWNKDISLRAEFDHMAFGSDSFTTLPAGNQNVGANLDLFKITFASRF